MPHYAIHNDKRLSGSVLIMVILLLSLLSLFAVTLLSLVRSQSVMARVFINHACALQCADSAIARFLANAGNTSCASYESQLIRQTECEEYYLLDAKGNCRQATASIQALVLVPIHQLDCQAQTHIIQWREVN